MIEAIIEDESGFAKFVNRFGLVGSGIALIILIDSFFVDGFFIAHFGIIAIVGVVLGGLSGFTSYNAFMPKHHRNHSGAAVIVWASGVLLVFVVAFLAQLLVEASKCFEAIAEAAPSSDGSETAKGAAADGAAALRLDPDCENRGDIVRLYSALQPWQTGIGAAIGLLGLAWSTMYRSVYEDWIEYQAPSTKPPRPNSDPTD